MNDAHVRGLVRAGLEGDATAGRGLVGVINRGGHVDSRDLAKVALKLRDEDLLASANCRFAWDSPWERVLRRALEDASDRAVAEDSAARRTEALRRAQTVGQDKLATLLSCFHGTRKRHEVESLLGGSRLVHDFCHGDKVRS